MKQSKKLIEVALPLEPINKAAAREKSIRHGHPSTLHLWWARRPLAAARAVIFAQMVDDPSSHPDLFPTELAQKKERGRLFKIIEDLVKWENTTNEEVLQKARDAIWESWRRACAENADHPRAKELFNREVLPAFHDPFAGGGALPLEAQRLGLESYASDLNPVAVLINKAMIEIPPRFAGKAPVNPEWQQKRDDEKAMTIWSGAQGLAADVRYYGQWMRGEAERRIGDLYPKIEVTADMARERPDLAPYVGRELTVIAWLWARTVKSPNPAFADVEVPLASTFMLSTKAGKEAYVEPVIEGGGYRFTIRVGKPADSAAAKNGFVGIHRDFGDRANRKHARLKYILHDRGVDWFKQELNARLGFELAPFAPQPALDLDLHLGWQEQGDGHWYLGISVENGRVQDEGTVQMRSGLREVIRRFRPNVRLTPNHDILLTDLHLADRPAIDALLAEYGIAQADQLSNVQLYSMACPALPTCGLALAESERVMPNVVDELEAAVAGIGLASEKFTVRMTGCPNGCARPYVADLAFVGRSADKYLVLVGGNQNGTQLNQPFADLVPLDQLVPSVLPLFVLFRDTRYPNEPFGDFCNRVGVEKLQQFATAYHGENIYA